MITPDNEKINTLTTIAPTITMIDAALWYGRHGWAVFPLHTPRFNADGSLVGCSCGNPKCANIGKHPRTKHGLKDATTAEATIRRWWEMWPDANIGLHCGSSGIVALDLDAYKEVYDGGDLLTLEEQETVTALTGGGGTHLLYAMPDGERLGNAEGDLPNGVNVRGWNGYIVLPPSLHASGRRYAWEPEYKPAQRALLPLPDHILTMIKATRNANQVQPVASLGRFQLPEKVLHLIGRGDHSDRSKADWIVAKELVKAGASDAEVEAIFRENPIGTMGKLAAKNGHGDAYLGLTLSKARAEVAAEKRQQGTWEDAPPNGVAPQTGDAGRERLTDLGNAWRFARLHGQGFRFTAGRGWLAWDGRRWARDDAGAVQRAAKETAVSLYADAAAATAESERLLAQAGDVTTPDDQRAKLGERATKRGAAAAALAAWAKTCQSRARIEAIIALSASELPIAARDADFDVNLWLLNCANGTLDLRTGVLRPHDPYDMLTTLAPTNYDPTATCPTWERFLHRIMGGNDALIGFLRRMVGYSLTGDVSEQVLFFLHGSGANGKSTLVNALFDVLGGDYAVQAASDLLIAKQGERHPTEVADLQGKRLVASVEVEDGRRMAEGLVKQLTGGDLLKARYMREDFFQFRPTHKLLLIANHKPTIRGTDYAIWRRIRLIPFEVTIPDAERDPMLPEKLRAESAGILAWAVRGCLEWQSIGLAAPTEVVAATETYRQESDTLGAFLNDCTVKVRDARTKSSALYGAYTKWAESAGVHPVNLMKFGLALAERGIEKDSTRTGVHYVGIGLLAEN